jgi:hypothetical protein
MAGTPVGIANQNRQRRFISVQEEGTLSVWVRLGAEMNGKEVSDEKNLHKQPHRDGCAARRQHAGSQNTSTSFG